MNNGIEKIRDALRFIEVGDHDSRFRMACSLKSELGEAGRDLWDEWRDGRGDDEANAVWRSVKTSGGIGIGSLFHEAIANGWSGNGSDYQRPTPEQLEARRVAREAEQEREAAVNHPYLVRKQVSPPETMRELAAPTIEKMLGYPPASGGELLTGRLLVIPVVVGGAVSTLELIDGDGRKAALAGGKKAGGYWATCKLPDSDGAGMLLLIGEGVATTTTAAATCQDSLQVGVAALSNGNLSVIAKLMRARFPAADIVILADLEKQTGKPDSHALEAARAVGARLAVPDFGEGREAGQKDMNDLFVLRGADAVRACIAAAITPDMPEHQPDGNNASEGDVVIKNYGGGRFEVSARGVFFIRTDDDGNEKPPQWLCSPLTVTAQTRDAKSGAWGRLLEWRDADGIRHQWAMPMELLQGDGADVRRELASQGLNIAAGKSARDLLSAYIQCWREDARARCVDRLGWHGGVYVTPHEAIGESGEVVVFQNAHAIEPAFATSGTVETWRDSVGALAAGNSRLVFALSIAFAGALADVAGEDSGGFHFRGASSSGKTTALKVAASVWGSPNAYPRLWRATVNGLEGLAALHNDGLLILDELSQADAKETGQAAYLLANGQGKARASRTGTARQSARWRLLFFSAGEESLSAMLSRAGRKPNAGQEIRLADIEADAGANMGVFEVLHGHATAAAFALAVKDAATQSHGAVGVEWLRRIVSDRSKLPDIIAANTKQFSRDVLPAEASGQVSRVARRFALAAVAGELATHYGLTGWEKGEAEKAAQKCFRAWLEGFGGAGNREERSMLSQVKAFFESHGASRFENLNADADQRIINRAGFFRTGSNGQTEYLVLPESFKRDVCQGYDAKSVTAALVSAGWLEKGSDGKSSQRVRINGMGQTRLYAFTGKMWEGE
jgi:uncharacterized protein (DUF927 family)